ncbi:oxidoreductase- 2OG-Fe(II) oxygenase family [Apiospora marii]|uniref:Oxidoreductase- 2OG-Fe(II) oxygenase family n=1 Tax=Apiospora marii TaxID=335849 RepID=A0ABR1RVB4_9PEZI
MDITGEKVAGLRTISLFELESGSDLEQDLLLQACTKDGFFYLNLTHPNYSVLLNDVESVFKVSERLFSYAPDVKSLFDVDEISDLKVNGYKPKGRNFVTTDKTDGFETWVLPRDGLLQLSNAPFSYPPLIASNLDPLRGIVRGLCSAAHLIFSSLSASLVLPAGQRLEDFQELSHPSPDILRLLKYHADSDTSCQPHVPHTDMGSLTFVFSSTPGLKVLPHDVSNKDQDQESSSLPWQYVSPRPGHAVVNIGDCLSLLTNGVLKSALHCVGPVEGRPMSERYSIAYLMRPEDRTVLRTLDSPKIPQPVPDQEDPITSGEWIRRKFKVLRGERSGGNSIDQILTGGRGLVS